MAASDVRNLALGMAIFSGLLVVVAAFSPRQRVALGGLATAGLGTAGMLLKIADEKRTAH